MLACAGANRNDKPNTSRSKGESSIFNETFYNQDVKLPQVRLTNSAFGRYPCNARAEIHPDRNTMNHAMQFIAGLGRVLCHSGERKWTSSLKILKQCRDLCKPTDQLHVEMLLRVSWNLIYWGCRHAKASSLGRWHSLLEEGTERNASSPAQTHDTAPI